MRWAQRIARAVTLGVALVACGPQASPDASGGGPTVVAPEASSPSDASAAPDSAPPRAQEPRVEAMEDGRCEGSEIVHPEPGVSRAGLRRGPSLLQLWTTRRGRWIGATASRLCVSDDDGATFRERFSMPARGEITLAQLERRGGWLAVGRRERDARNPQSDAPRPVIGAWISTDEEAREFAPLALPTARDQTIYEVFTDRLGTLYASTERALYRREGAEGEWQGPLALPGRSARAVDACGRVLIARSTVDADGSYWFRSFDHGGRWSPFRLGVLGLDADRAVVRCLGARGAIEAGRLPLPTHWSFDGGRTWKAAPYDDRARRLARERGAHAVRCRNGPADTIECQDESRTRLVEGSARDLEIYAPGQCESVTALDTRTTVAFGPACGLLVSGDRGGLWRQRSAPWIASESAQDEGRGGFVDRRAAWRLDGSVWWTFDGGARWAPVASVIGRTLDRGVFVDRRRGVFVTSTGWVVATRDGGRTFTYVLRGEVERISAEGTRVYITTPTTVRVSPDGGVHWWLPGVGASGARLRPTVEREGDARIVRLTSGVRVEQRGVRVELVSGEERAPLASIDDARTVLIAADQDARLGVRALLSDGTILTRRPPRASAGAPTRARPRLARASRRRRR